MNINIKIIKSIRKNKKNRINCKEKIDTITKENDINKTASTTTKEMSNEYKKKNTGTDCQTKNIYVFPNIKLILSFVVQNLHLHLKAIILNLNLTHKIARPDCDLLSFSKTKKQRILRKIFFKY